MIICANDCSPIPGELDQETLQWLARLSRSVRAKDHVLEINGGRSPDEPIVFCDWDGTWRTGRYIGSITHQGKTLVIRPRLGIETIRKWLARVHNLLLVQSSGQLKADESFIAELLGRVWGHGFAEAARHGLPCLPHDHVHTGNVIRGRLDVAATIRSSELLHGRAVSVRRMKTLKNPIARTIGCAFAVLRRWLGAGTERTWLPPRCVDLLPQIVSANGLFPDLPTESELADIRYTPITECYRRFVRLSWQIARQRGLFANTDDENRSTGVLLDIAELWEMYVISVLREAALPNVIVHGTREQNGRDFLLHSGVDDGPLAELRPDAVMKKGNVIEGVFDAKYKFLHSGPNREDLYQIGAYLMGFGGEIEMPGFLVYPQAPNYPEASEWERRNPWRIDRRRSVFLLTFPHDSNEAVAKARSLIESCNRMAGMK